MTSRRLHIFERYGVELEYMIVNRDTLDVMPIADELIKEKAGTYESDFENGLVTWSNELVLHVIELKSTKPESDFPSLEKAFVQNVQLINTILQKWNAMLMPGAAHPIMDPHTDLRLWPHDNNEVYEVYNKIFDCRGHGWANLQSTHLNLPFCDDEEFRKLHAAIRLVLPILPALCASSPIIDGKVSGITDTRLSYYKKNQASIPSIVGSGIPEAVFSEKDYAKTIYEKIQSDIKPFDTDEILDPIWVNSRGAIARFDRGSIEIRLMDVQECPAADLAITTLVIETIKTLVNEEFISLEDQMKWNDQPLSAILDDLTINGRNASIRNSDYLKIFGFHSSVTTAGELWQFNFDKINLKIPDQHKTALKIILTKGNLSERIVSAVGINPTKERIISVYKELAGCVTSNRLF
ncbi:MAG: glutamate-cysteine ligase family protein [Flammeovirgaceae bacterium]|nr:glutamate-cysteine ligase family protein [Flammeovirgaceae bacterium]